MRSVLVSVTFDASCGIKTLEYFLLTQYNESIEYENSINQ